MTPGLKFILFIGALSPLFTMRVIPEPAQYFVGIMLIALSYREYARAEQWSMLAEIAIIHSILPLLSWLRRGRLVQAEPEIVYRFEHFGQFLRQARLQDIRVGPVLISPLNIVVVF